MPESDAPNAVARVVGGETSNIAKALDGDPAGIVKAYLIRGAEGGSESQILSEPDKQQSLFSSTGALAPLYDPYGLAMVFESSSCLRPNVDAYVTNIDSFGHQFVPIIDLDAPEAAENVRTAMRLERRAKKQEAALAAEKSESDKDALSKSDEVSDSDLKKRMDQLRSEMALERAELETFFDNCTVDIPFSGHEGLRGITRYNLEVTGNGFWEVLRDGFGRIAQFNPIPATSMRVYPTDDEITEVEIPVRTSLLTWSTIKARKRFRKLVQCWETNTRVVYFKEFGDPRCMSARTGRIFANRTALERAESDLGQVQEATEVIWFKITSIRSVYGAPRWIGALLAVLGNRQAEEMNFIYFENRSVPPLAILVSGGRLAADSVAKLEDHIRTNIKGARNSHKILILEAEPASSMQQAAAATGTPSRMKIELKPLTEAQLTDATFQAYDERNTGKVGEAFRMPKLLRGDVRDFNRNTAGASIDFAEVQVFNPLRQEFDWHITKQIFPALGVRYHTFRSNSPSVRDPQALAEMIERLVKASVLTPAEGRVLCGDVFNGNLPVIDASWTKQPVALTLAGLNAKKGEEEGGPSQDKFNANGGMSAPGAGATQEALGVSKEAFVALLKDFAAGQQRTDDDDEDEDDDELDEKAKERLRVQKLQISALIKLREHMREQEVAKAKEAWDSMERVIIQLPEAEMRALFERVDE